MTASLLWPLGSTAAALGSGPLGLSLADCDQGRTLDRLTLDTGWPSGAGQALVYDARGDLRAAVDPASAVDFVDDIWVFDHGTDGRAELVVTFTQDAGKSVALLYDDRDGDGEVLYEVADCRLEVVESPYWTTRVESDGQWLLPDGRTNLNLTVDIDGHLARELDKGLFPAAVLGRLTRDGSVDTRSVVRDQDADGAAEYAYSRILTPISQSAFSVLRFNAWVNERNLPSVRPTGYVFWPLLGGSYAQRNYFDTPPYFAMDWPSARLVDFGLHGYPIEHGYHVSSMLAVDPARLNETDFESPMAYYDLADDRDGEPELHVRFEIYPGGDPNLREIRSRQPINNVRYSWNQQNLPGLHWDYKLGLLGRQTPPGEVALGDLRLRLPVHATLPDWVVGERWEWGTLVANEGSEQHASEGIYDLSASYPGYLQYLAGQSEVSPDAIELDLPPGLRGERAVLAGPPRLYLDSVDRRLHLSGVREGRLQMLDGRVLRYGGSGDGPVDTWTLLQHEADLQALHVADDQALLRDEGGVLIKTVSNTRVLFTLPPPANHQEWRLLGQLLERHGSLGPTPEPAALFAQLGGEAERLPGARLPGFRRTATGFEVLLELATPVEVPPWLAGRPPGAYLVQFERGAGYRVAPFVPTGLALTHLDLLTETGPVELAPLALRVVLRNPDPLDADGVELRLLAQDEGAVQAGGAPAEAENLEVSPNSYNLPAGGEVEAVARWTPPRAGTWTVRAELAGDGLSEPAVRTLRLEVLPTELTVVDSFSLFGNQPIWLAPALLLSALTTGLALGRLVVGRLHTDDLA